MTELFLSDVSRYDGRIDKLLEGIPDFISEHCKRHKNEEDLQASLLGWNILIMIFKSRNIDIDSLKLTYNENNKPYLGTHWFSISHSKSLVAVCYSDSEVGCDIEYVDNSRDYQRLSEEYLSPKEKEMFDSSSDKANTFTSLWTRKEAFHKHVGDGVTIENRRRELPYSDIYTTYLTDKNNDGYYLSVDCIDNQKVQIRIV